MKGKHISLNVFNLLSRRLCIILYLFCRMTILCDIKERAFRAINGLKLGMKRKSKKEIKKEKHLKTVLTLRCPEE